MTATDAVVRAGSTEAPPATGTSSHDVTKRVAPEAALAASALPESAEEQGSAVVLVPYAIGGSEITSTGEPTLPRAISAPKENALKEGEETRALVPIAVAATSGVEHDEGEAVGLWGKLKRMFSA